ncbi:hypothetical protein TNCV_1131621 [Trichonephila clavipes]|nr:hypothetical protein TNCV_1131621 [Trichonephila clavipes]
MNDRFSLKSFVFQERGPIFPLPFSRHSEQTAEAPHSLETRAKDRKYTSEKSWFTSCYGDLDWSRCESRTQMRIQYK